MYLRDYVFSLKLMSKYLTWYYVFYIYTLRTGDFQYCIKFPYEGVDWILYSFLVQNTLILQRIYYNIVTLTLIFNDKISHVERRSNIQFGVYYSE